MLFLSITQLVRCPSLERDWSSGDHVPIPGWVAPQIFIHKLQYMSGSPTQQQTSLTSPAGIVYTFRFSFVLLCLEIIDPVHQGDAQLSHPLCQVSAVPVTVWCSGLAILCVVMYLIVWRFALNHARVTTVHILGWEHQSGLPVDLHIWWIAFPVCIWAVLECVYCPTVDYIIG